MDFIWALVEHIPMFLTGEGTREMYGQHIGGVFILGLMLLAPIWVAEYFGAHWKIFHTAKAWIAGACAVLILAPLGLPALLLIAPFWAAYKWHAHKKGDGKKKGKKKGKNKGKKGGGGHH